MPYNSTWQLARYTSREALASSEGEKGRLLIDQILRSMNPKLRGRVAHMVHRKSIQDRRDYWQLVKFAVKKEGQNKLDA